MPSSPSLSILLLLLISLSISCSASRSPYLIAVGGEGRKVGGRTAVENVRSNREVQDLGRFSVEEYNQRGGGEAVAFGRVVEAERQVVSGIKYYLRIEAADRVTGGRRVFDAVVVVRPWVKKSRVLVSFAPTSNS